MDVTSTSSAKWLRQLEKSLNTLPEYSGGEVVKPALPSGSGVSKKDQKYTCPVCKVPVACANQAVHNKGKKHVKALSSVTSHVRHAPLSVVAPSDQHTYLCNVCKVPVAYTNQAKHNKGKKHLQALTSVAIRVQQAPSNSTAPAVSVPQGRNLPCACGSGKKFKMCCEEKSPPTMFNANPSRTRTRGQLARPGLACSSGDLGDVTYRTYGGASDQALPAAVQLIDAHGPEVTLAEQIAQEHDVPSTIASDDGADSNDEDCPKHNPFDAIAQAYFVPKVAQPNATPRTTLYGRDKDTPIGIELGLLGHAVAFGDRDADPNEIVQPEPIYINVTDPFCLITIGVQGSGKSHTLNSVLEACLIPCPPITHVAQPMSALVCHYDRSDVNCCEATGLGQPCREIAQMLKSLGSAEAPPSLPQHKLLVLCSPTYYIQRKKFYEGVCEVRPLMFSWNRLRAQQIKMLMKLDESSTQLYISLMLDVLRGYQRKAKMPAFQDFLREFEGMCSGTQSGPLKQRFQLLASFVAESDVNKPIADVGVDLADVMEAGKLVVIDLTDPMMSPSDANSIFEVVLDTFRCKHLKGCGKVVAFDEAHRYMGIDGSNDALAREVTDCARLMRHEGLRVIISTQSPKAMPEELLELTSVLVAHRFQSIDWHKYLSKKVPLPEESFSAIRALETGEAIVYSARPCVACTDNEALREVLRVQVRERLTADRGGSKRNRVNLQ